MCRDSFRQRGVAVSKRTYGNAPDEIKVTFAINIFNEHPPPLDKRQGLASIGARDVALIELSDALHSLSPLDHRAYAALGQDLEQEGMGHGAFEDVAPFDTTQYSF